MDYVSHALKDVAKIHGGASIGGLISPQATLEEMYLAQKILRGIGSENIDFRLRQSDFSADGKLKGVPWLGMKIADISRLDRVLVVGSFLRKDHPLIAQRLRQSAKRGTQVNFLHCSGDDQLIKLTGRAIVAPSLLPAMLAQIVKAVAQLKCVAIESSMALIDVSEEAQKIADSLVSGSRIGVLFGNFAQQHPQSAVMHTLGNQLAQLVGGTLGLIGEAANSVGGYVANAVPSNSGMNVSSMLADPRKAYLVIGNEPELDCANGAQALVALKSAASVIVLSPFKSLAALEYSDVLLPISAFAETSGSFINTEGRVQSFHAAVKPQGDAKPAWKVLRVLGNLLQIPGCDYSSSEDVRNEVLGGSPEFAPGLDNGIDGIPVTLFPHQNMGFERLAEIPIHFADGLARRAPSLQKTRDAKAPTARLNAAMLKRLDIASGDEVKVGAGDTAVVRLAVELDDGLADNVVRIPAAHFDTVALGALAANLTVGKA